MEKNNDNNKKRVYIRPEDTLEFVYELSDKWKDNNTHISDIRAELRTMIRYFKEEKFDKLQDEFGVGL